MIMQLRFKGKGYAVEELKAEKEKVSEDVH